MSYYGGLGGGYYGGYFAPEAPINAVVQVAETEQIYPYAGVEPLSVEDAKAYCKIDFDDEDVLIGNLITSTRLSLESFTGVSFVQKRLIVQVINLCGGIELPHGPIPGGPAAIDKTLVTDGYGNAIDEGLIILSGISYQNLPSFVNVAAPCSPLLEFIYSAGYPTLPEDLLTAMKAMVFFLYENRGEDAGISSGIKTYGVSYIPKDAYTICERHKRVSNLSM